MALSRSAKFYRENPDARKKHVAYQAEYNKKPREVKKRVELNAYNRKHKDPKGNKTDASHKNGKIVGFVHQSKNRGDKDNSIGDKRSRNPRFRLGGKKK
jgi:hypothetical protein